jgi:hypothetical protein
VGVFLVLPRLSALRGDWLSGEPGVHLPGEREIRAVDEEGVRMSTQLAVAMILGVVPDEVDALRLAGLARCASPRWFHLVAP